MGIDIIDKVKIINREIEKKQHTAELCKRILDSLTDPTEKLTQELIELKSNYPEKYEEIEPIIKEFLIGNKENIDTIWNFLVNDVLNIWENIEINSTEESIKNWWTKLRTATITHMKNKLFDTIRSNIFSDEQFVFSMANAINELKKDNLWYKSISPYSKREIEFEYKNKIVKLSIANIMQYIGKQQTGSINKFREWHEALMKYLEENNFIPNESSTGNKDWHDDKTQEKELNENLLPEDFSKIPLAIKNNKENLYVFMSELRKKLGEKVPDQHFIRIKPTNSEVSKIELSIIVNNFIIKNNVHNIYNALSKMFFNKQWNFAQVHQLLIEIPKIDQDILWERNISSQDYPQTQNDTEKKKKEEKITSNKEKQFISTTDIELSFANIMKKNEGSLNLDKFIEYYKIREDDDAMKKLQIYKNIIRQFTIEIEKFTTDKSIVEKIKKSIKDIIDNKLNTPLKAFNYVHKERYGWPTSVIIDIIKKYNNGN